MTARALVAVALGATSFVVPRLAAANYHPDKGYHRGGSRCPDNPRHAVGQLSMCSRFGEWSLPAFLAPIVDVGLARRQFRATIEDGSAANERADTFVGVGPRFRVLAGTGPMYTGMELEYVAVASTSMAVAAGAVATRPAHDFAMLTVLGARTRTWRVSFAGELAAGWRTRSFACTGDCPDITPHDNSFVLEARGRVELWLATRVAVAVSAGTSVRELHDTSLVVSLVASTAPFGGR